VFCRHPSDGRSSFANTCSPPPQIPGRPSAPCAMPSGVPPTWSSPSPRSQMSCRRAPTSTTSRRPILTAVRSARLHARAVPAGCLPGRTPAPRQWLLARSVAAGPQACGDSSAASAPSWEAGAGEHQQSERAATRRPAARLAPSSPDDAERLGTASSALGRQPERGTSQSPLGRQPEETSLTVGDDAAGAPRPPSALWALSRPSIPRRPHPATAPAHGRPRESNWLPRRCTRSSRLRQHGPQRAAASGTNKPPASCGNLLNNDNEPPRRAARVTLNRRRPTLPGPCEPSTIGAERLNFSVRNGKRCFPLAKATGNLREIPAAPQNRTAHHMGNSRRSKNKTVKPSSH
jgi:hypothetical protein